MPLSVADFASLELAELRDYLSGFDSRTRKKGEGYFRGRAVTALTCVQAGAEFSATVQGTYKYKVEIGYDDGWEAVCSCPIAYECKHVYAVARQLLAEHERLAPSGAITLSHPEPKGFAALVQNKLGRKLSPQELNFLKVVHQLFQRSLNGGLHYRHELAPLGLNPTDLGYWSPLELYPAPPLREEDFWNYLALYLDEKIGWPVPEFLLPVTDLAKPRAVLRKHFRARDIERWKQTLGEFDGAAYAGVPQVVPDSPAAVAELRVRFLPLELSFEWRPAGALEWKELKPRKAADFEFKYASSLSAETSLLWLSFWQRVKMQYSTNFLYTDAWVQEQVSRWLRHPLLRPHLAGESGQPLVFHEAPLRWRLAQPEQDDGDYSFSLVQADEQPAPQLRLAARGNPAVYLTADGVFTGPPFENYLMSSNNQTLIPAKALESAAGLILLQRLQLATPPRLAARVRTIPLLPGIRAEIKTPPGGSEYCDVEVFAASADGEFVERWTGTAWTSQRSLATPDRKGSLLQFDRSSAQALLRSLDLTAFRWDPYLQRWQMRVTKKFAEAFIAFLKSLPPGTRIDLAGELASFQNTNVAGKIRLEASEAELDWFDLRVIVDVNDATLTPEEIKLLLDAKGNWVRLGKKGWRKLEFALSEEEDRELARLGLTPHELTSEPQRLHAFQLADHASRKFLPEETCQRIERRAAELQARVTPALPAQIRGDLRPYQLDGFHFLAYLSTNRFGGILADDMGLGKTLQTLAWLAWLRHEPKPEKSAAANGLLPVEPPAAPLPSLVVCPKSVADNWQAEAVKFFPDLKVRVWSARDLKGFASRSADLHVLNYSQLRLAGDAFLRESFHAVVLDEGQYIKNPGSKTAQIARQLRSEHRLILSGTPIENRLLDLWSLMSFAMPGALGSRAEFGRLYDAKNDPFARQRLSARVRPFLIRRTKAQVARDLPERVEEDLFCELEGEQKTLYRAELKRAQAMLLGVKTAAALNKQRFNFLTSLLRLRQICCHPRLVKPDSKAASAKVEALLETLEPLMEEGEKVLVFSQFVELLALLRAELEGRGWRHWYLAGDTENRGDLVRDFQAAEGAGVFLISLKAGGFGLNLTAASYVVLFDPWWNPAVENQAIDRTHRIGQDQKVVAYRLLIKNSIEEKIRALQRQKSSLAADVLGEEKFSQSLSLDDLRYLLAS